ncbi:MAG: DNA-binding protein [Alphaproteobacteria bacterium]
MTDTGDVGFLYGVKAIAQCLGITETACRHLVEKGVLPTWKQGKMVCSSREGLRDWLKRQQASADAGATTGTAPPAGDLPGAAGSPSDPVPRRPQPRPGRRP